jgi:dTDP-4-amino-4,6-dideoxygalactose transaminase
MYLTFSRLKKRGGKALFPAITCMAPINAAIYAGMEVAFCDVNLNDFTMDTGSLINSLDSNDIAVIVPTHIYGNSCELDEILKIAEDRGVFVLEDAAQSVGGKYKDRMLGSFGEASIISFGHSKILECGGGGAVLTDDEALYIELKKADENLPRRPDNVMDLFDHYRKAYYGIDGLSSDEKIFRRLMLELQVSSRRLFLFRITPEIERRIFNAIDRLDEVVALREARRMLYERHLDNTDLAQTKVRDGSVCWRYSCLYKHDRKKLLTRIREQGIDVSNWYQSQDKIYSADEEGMLKNAECVDRGIVNFWVTQDYSEEKILNDIDAINRIFKEVRP